MIPGAEIGYIQPIYAIATLNSAILAAVLWRYRDHTGMVPLLVNVLCAGVWAGSLLALTVVDSGLLALAFLGLLFLGVGFSSMTLLVFTLEYTGRERFVRPPVLAALSIEPVLVLFFAVVNPGNLFFTLSGDAVEWGIAFWIHVVYAYAILAVTTALIFDLLYRSRSLYRGQSAALLVGTFAAWIANVVYIFGPIEFDTSPIGFLVAGILYGVAIVRYRLTDVVPIARDRVLETVSDGIFVVNDEDRLIDINPEGRRILRIVGVDDGGQLIGRPFPSLVDGTAFLYPYEEITSRDEETSVEVSTAANHFQVIATPIDDGRDRHVGWLLIAHDITQRNRHEERLEQQNERLKRFADIVSHDLRNPLNVADGYVDLAREADDPARYFDEIERSHDRMETIIEDVLALARDGADVTDPKPVSLADLAEQAWESVDTRDATLSVTSEMTILADAKRVTRLLENLFRNSVEHGTPDGTDDGADPLGSSLEIEVGTIAADDGDGPVGFYVADDGQGLPDEGEDVFEDGYTTDAEGTGFGLSIVRGIATAHGWTVTAGESERGGARFEFRGVDSAPDSSPSDSASGADIEAESSRN